MYDMEQSDTWGDHICLQAIADAYGLKINIITSYPQQDSCFIGITPDKVKTHRILYLSFWAEIHYNSIYPKRYYPNLNADPYPSAPLASYLTVQRCYSVSIKLFDNAKLQARGSAQRHRILPINFCIQL